ncbi:unnamed protein product [Vitrella brassicaformis CCMP3155]|uniref:EF-hand domain-containing protein n=2 Tax=Vitrella brassicaformis TaxID=1169539 RepID=A0A0G4EQF7_VITBC|nr:unnamed protein product [Vitrella brassicaformis CCMP3155]|eukprot:CEL99701.1 unnamed protein product [Vitrella brassicaformis CCMP3155]
MTLGKLKKGRVRRSGASNRAPDSRIPQEPIHFSAEEPSTFRFDLDRRKNFDATLRGFAFNAKGVPEWLKDRKKERETKQQIQPTYDPEKSLRLSASDFSMTNMLGRAVVPTVHAEPSAIAKVPGNKLLNSTMSTTFSATSQSSASATRKGLTAEKWSPKHWHSDPECFREPLERDTPGSPVWNSSASSKQARRGKHYDRLMRTCASPEEAEEPTEQDEDRSKKELTRFVDYASGIEGEPGEDEGEDEEAFDDWQIRLRALPEFSKISVLKGREEERKVDINRTKTLRKMLRERYAGRQKLAGVWFANTDRAPGYMLPQDLQDLVDKMGVQASLAECRTLIAAVDRDDKGAATFSEFNHLIFSTQLPLEPHKGAAGAQGSFNHRQARNLIRTLTAKLGAMPREFWQVDVNDEGHITLPQFDTALKRAVKGLSCEAVDWLWHKALQLQKREKAEPGITVAQGKKALRASLTHPDLDEAEQAQQQQQEGEEGSSPREGQLPSAVSSGADEHATLDWRGFLKTIAAYEHMHRPLTPPTIQSELSVKRLIDRTLPVTTVAPQLLDVLEDDSKNKEVKLVGGKLTTKTLETSWKPQDCGMKTLNYVEQLRLKAWRCKRALQQALPESMLKSILQDKPLIKRSDLEKIIVQEVKKIKRKLTQDMLPDGAGTAQAETTRPPAEELRPPAESEFGNVIRIDSAEGLTESQRKRLVPLPVGATLAPKEGALARIVSPGYSPSRAEAGTIKEKAMAYRPELEEALLANRGSGAMGFDHPLTVNFKGGGVKPVDTYLAPSDIQAFLVTQKANKHDEIDVRDLVNNLYHRTAGGYREDHQYQDALEPSLRQLRPHAMPVGGEVSQRDAGASPAPTYLHPRMQRLMAALQDAVAEKKRASDAAKPSKMFRRLNMDGDGYVDLEDLTRAAQQYKIAAAPEDLRDLMHALDESHNGSVDIGEFTRNFQVVEGSWGDKMRKTARVVPQRQDEAVMAARLTTHPKDTEAAEAQAVDQPSVSALQLICCRIKGEYEETKEQVAMKKPPGRFDRTRYDDHTKPLVQPSQPCGLTIDPSLRFSSSYTSTFNAMGAYDPMNVSLTDAQKKEHLAALRVERKRLKAEEYEDQKVVQQSCLGDMQAKRAALKALNRLAHERRARHM